LLRELGHDIKDLSICIICSSNPRVGGFDPLWAHV
jgi:hypothetical protein